MENAFVKAAVHPDGTFNLTDKRTGVRYRGLNRLRDQGDAGNLYVSKLLADHVVAARLRDGRMWCVESLPDRATMQVTLHGFKAPVGLSADRTRREGERVGLWITFFITLYAHSPAVHVRAEWHNEHQGHRLTVEFPTPFRTADTHAGSTFDVVEHRAPFRQASCRDFVTAADGRARLTILSRSMHAYDGQRVRGRLVLGKCLLKASGFVNDGVLPYWTAPEGQCIRHIVQEYAVLPGRAGDSWAALSHAAEDFSNAPFVDYSTSAGPAWEGPLPRAHSFLTVSSPFELSACKRCEDRPGLLVRAVNMSDRPARLQVDLSPLLGAKRAWRTDLRERRLRPLPLRANRLQLAARPREIVTLEVT